MQRKSYVGCRNGKLVVFDMEYVKSESGKSRSFCICKCDCGATHKVSSSHFKSRKNLSCGCDLVERRSSSQVPRLEGKRFGRLLVVKQVDRSKTKRVTWECICDCGNITYVNSAQLLGGNTQSCGCLQKEKASQLRKKDWANIVSEYGVTINQLDHIDKHGIEYWTCTCGICGKHFVALPAKIMSGHTKSCGCKKYESRGRIDLKGKRFGMLTAMEPIYEKRKMTKWKCLCDCGKETIVAISALRDGGNYSCGCTIVSKGEKSIANILEKHDMLFKEQVRIKECRRVRPLPFDFGVYDKNGDLLLLIEYQGEQHYRSVEYFGGNASFKKRLEADEIKRSYCYKNNIPLLCLPYTLKREEIEREIINIIYP